MKQNFINWLSVATQWFINKQQYFPIKKCQLTHTLAPKFTLIYTIIQKTHLYVRTRLLSRCAMRFLATPHKGTEPFEKKKILRVGIQLGI